MYVYIIRDKVLVMVWQVNAWMREIISDWCSGWSFRRLCYDALGVLVSWLFPSRDVPILDPPHLRSRCLAYRSFPGSESPVGHPWDGPAHSKCLRSGWTEGQLRVPVIIFQALIFTLQARWGRTAWAGPEAPCLTSVHKHVTHVNMHNVI